MGPNHDPDELNSETFRSDDTRNWSSSIRPLSDPALKGFGFDTKGNLYFKGTWIGKSKRFSRFTRTVAALGAGAALAGAAATALSAPLDAEPSRREDEIA